MVVMYYGPGQLAAVRPTGKYWELEELSIPEDSKGAALPNKTHLRVNATHRDLFVFSYDDAFLPVRSCLYRCSQRTLHWIQIYRVRFTHESLNDLLRFWVMNRAEGKTLQAIGGEQDSPLRVNNYNFGTWEMWESTAAGFVNRKWPQKVKTIKTQHT